MIDDQDIKKIVDALVIELKNKGFIHKQKRPTKILEAIKANKVKKDVYIKNQEIIDQWNKSGYLKADVYNFPEEGPYDWKYIIDHGEKLTPSKTILAMYWREKSVYTKLGKIYSFPTKGMAGAMMLREMKDAERLASAIEFKDFRRLVELVDDKYSEMFKTRGGFEWKLKNLVDNVDLLI